MSDCILLILGFNKSHQLKNTPAISWGGTSDMRSPFMNEGCEDSTSNLHIPGTPFSHQADDALEG